MKNLCQADGWYVKHDGCITIRWRNYNTGEEVSQRKRRRAGITPQVCTWAVKCDDHPEHWRERYIQCPACGKSHLYLRLNLAIICECGRRIERHEQIAIVNQTGRKS